MNFYGSDSALIDEKSHGHEKSLSDLQQMFQVSPIYKYSPNFNFVFLGYTYQGSGFFLKDSAYENRLFQQVVYRKNSDFGVFTHRVRLETRFIQNEEPNESLVSTRLRYQLGFLMPLKGDRIENGKFYLNAYNEFFFNLTGAGNSVFNDNWSYIGIGYNTLRYGKFETGPLVQRAVINHHHDVRYTTMLQVNWSYDF
ncbi:hypothetical protein W03_15850 [Nitrosomonas sp. PY1]|uniref:DUF2490 domain-containing protein n=1 Tax=Nitrosomonas sp. PY1 TaxID=1803906 RepID=UPI001FC8E80E|nr:DUF2490 domain-containing protein [Nitrosomonas sp. PY1]GKS69581.1 hypothetical protein W03_15850 [Nitrosomonas sp. PY1]